MDTNDQNSFLSSTVFSCVAATLGLLLVGLGPNWAEAQTPTTTIQNGNADTRLQLNYDGGLHVPGTFGPTTPADSIPATGAGTRMMWYPAKAAFRAGRVGISSENEDLWNATNVGEYSVAFGRETQASGIYGVALGDRTTASAEAATAMGTQTTASGENTVAMGLGTTADALHSVSMGVCNDAGSNIFSGPLLIVGNGGPMYSDGTCDTRSDALVLDDQGDLTISGDLTQNSDRRLKTEIEPLEGNVLQRLSELRPVRYKFKDQRTHPSGEQIGLVAQDVKKEFPTLVTEGTGGMLSLAYPKMTALLLKGLQEQQSTIEEQQAQISDLKSENEKLRTRVDQIEDLKTRLAALEAERSPSIVAGLTGSGAGLLLAFLLGGLFGAGLLWRRGK